MTNNERPNDFWRGFYEARGVLGNTYCGDSSNYAERAKRKIAWYDRMSDEYKSGFLSGVYSLAVCG